MYDLLIHTNKTIGENSLDEIIEIAEKLSIKGIGIEMSHSNIEKIPKTKGIDIISTVIIQPKSVFDLNESVKSIRQKAELVVVSGGNYDINRASCENKMVDILLHPELNRKDCGLDHICIKEAAKNNVSIGISFHSISESFKKQRIVYLSSIRKTVMLCKKYSANIIVVSDSITKWDMRSPRDMVSLMHVLGFSLEDSVKSISKIPEKMIKNNRSSMSGKRWVGVDVVD